LGYRGLLHHNIERFSPQEDHLIETFSFDRFHEPFASVDRSTLRR
jgi:hypothetical protein